MIIAGSVVVVVEIVVITVVVNIIVHCYCHHYYNLVHIHFTVLQLFGAPLLGSLPKYIYRRSLLFTYHSFVSTRVEDRSLNLFFAQASFLFSTTEAQNPK